VYFKTKKLNTLEVPREKHLPSTTKIPSSTLMFIQKSKLIFSWPDACVVMD